LFLREFNVQLRCGAQELSAKMAKPKNAQEKAKNTLDTVSQKGRRGPKPKVDASAVRGRADNYRGILNNVWDQLWPPLSKAQTEDDVIRAFQEGYPGESEFMPYRTPLILKVLKERTFPKRRKAHINFLADSLAGLGLVSPRRSRDICAEDRARAKSAHHIIRYEFYVECSCGYTGFSRDHACPTCGAGIPLELDLIG
jgi:hypothetical protein